MKPNNMSDNPDIYQKQIKQLKTKIADNKKLLSDPEFKSLAEEEISRLKKELASLNKYAQEYKDTLTEQEEAEQDETLTSSAILELRAGAGGDEAKIWAEDLLRMYVRYSQNKNLKVEFIDNSVLKISKKTKLKITLVDSDSKETKTVNKTLYPYQLFKHEAGVHRVQRVPATETQGRIHTSTASVAVLPEIKADKIKIKDTDLNWEFMRSSGAGGQSVNKTSSAVRLTHKPSGIVIRVSQERKQLQNRALALELLRSQLWSIEQEKKEEKIQSARSAIGRSMRAEKIRTYNYPQNRVTDHRINESWHQLENIIEGDLDPVISTVKAKISDTSDEHTMDK